MSWKSILALGACLALASSTAQAQAPLITGLGGASGFGTGELRANDDGSSPEIDITPTFPGGIQLFGTLHRRMFVNNNGNVTFAAPTSSFTPEAFPVSDNPMIAAWWSDVDTRGAVATPHAQRAYWSVAPDRIVVTWYLVGYYSYGTDQLNSFQIVIRPVGTSGDFDVELRYERCQWSYGGDVQAGFDGGDRVNYRELPYARTTEIVRLCTESNAGSPGLYRFSVRAGQILPCGDGHLDAGELCDDHNGVTGDGCSTTCRVETGYACSGSPSACAARCGDGILLGSEACDDGDTAAGDGCGATCAVETGFECTGAPSHCSTVCGDGVVSAAETCDDGGVDGGDGCDASCTIEAGWACAGAPSACTTVCGDGRREGAEGCDDGNASPGDGCDACVVESGWLCAGLPSECQTQCTDGILAGAEGCDDGNYVAGDGCSTTCEVEAGWACVGGSCGTTCGDGIVTGGEACDDGNVDAADGCSDACEVEHGFACDGMPSACVAACGDGVVAQPVESCDDGAATDGDGCSAACRTEVGWACAGEPSACTTGCGDGIVAGAESCDDGGIVDGDGCSATCAPERGWACGGDLPTTCAAICGDGIVRDDEACDDGNVEAEDGCSATCGAESGFTCEGEPSRCALVGGEGSVPPDGGVPAVQVTPALRTGGLSCSATTGRGAAPLASGLALLGLAIAIGARRRR